MFGKEEAEKLRMATRERVQLDLRTPGIFLGPSSRRASQIAQSWLNPPRRVSWDWERISKNPRGADLDLTIWYEGELCGLAFGRAGASWVELSRLEANPNEHPLQGRVMDIALAVLSAQKSAFGMPESRIIEPFDAVMELYRERGWQHLVRAGGTHYLTDREPT